MMSDLVQREYLTIHLIRYQNLHDEVEVDEVVDDEVDDEVQIMINQNKLLMGKYSMDLLLIQVLKIQKNQNYKSQI
jgi:hypothetical protein